MVPSPGSNDHYATLGVPHGADEREIKRAYFRLVRLHPPESAPEEFQRIRRAYEVLSDAALRRDYDARFLAGDEAGERVRAGREALERGEYKLAQAELRHALVLDPTLDAARDLLGMAYLQNGQPREALVQFEHLLRNGAESAVYFLHKGYAHNALREHQAAQSAFERATKLDPRDRKARQALADAYLAAEQYELALGALDQAMRLEGEEGDVEAQLDLLCRKVRLQLARRRPDLADDEIARATQKLPGGADVRRLISTRLAALAAELFRTRRAAEAHLILERAHAIDRQRSWLGLRFPPSLRLALRDLPAASLAELEKLRAAWATTKIAQGVWGVPILLLLAALGLSWGATYNVTAGELPWKGDGRAFAFVLLVGAPLFLVYALRRVWRANSPIGRYTVIHPLYLLQVNVDRLTAWPLVHLSDVSLTHHLQNGIYQHTVVRMIFGEQTIALNIRGEQRAVDWAQGLLDARDRVLSMMSLGALDEEDLDLIPRRYLAGELPPPSGAVLRRRLALYGGTAAAAVIAFFAVATPLNRSAADHASWKRIERERRYAWDSRAELMNRYRSYLVHFPDGKHADLARGELRREYDRARDRYLRDCPSGRSCDSAPGARAVAAIIDALRDQDQPRTFADLYRSRNQVGVRVHGESRLIGSDGTVLEAANDRRGDRESEFVRSLERGLNQRVPRDVLSLVSTVRETKPASIDVEYKLRLIRLRPDLPAAAGRTIATAEMTLRVLVDGAERHQTRIAVTDAGEELDPDDYADDGESEGTLGRWERALLDRAFDRAGALLAQDLGFRWPEVARAAPSRSGYPFDSLGGNAEISPEMWRLIERLKRQRQAAGAARLYRYGE